MSSSDESPDEQADGGEIVIDGKTPLNSSAATSPLSTGRSQQADQWGAGGVVYVPVKETVMFNKKGLFSGSGKRNTLSELVCRSGLCSFFFLFGFLSVEIIAALFSLFFSRLRWQWAGWSGGLKEMRKKRITLDVPEINTTRENCTEFLFHTEKNTLQGYLL